MTKRYELDCHDSRKRFYKKAMVIEENGVKYLQSYQTIVAMIDGGILYKFWDNYSWTTMRHINSFLIEFGLSTMSKKEWLDYPTSRREDMVA